MPDGTFCAADVDHGSLFLALFTKEEIFDRTIFSCIAKRCTCGMRVDIVDSTGLDSRMPKSVLHGEARALSIFARCSHMMCIT